MPKRPAPFVPYLYRPEEVQRLLAATDRLDSAAPVTLPSATFRTLLLLLYGTGLRLGEALALTLADVDLPGRVLIVRAGKFYKTRLVPVGPQLTQVLAAYAQVRGRLPRPAGMPPRPATSASPRSTPSRASSGPTARSTSPGPPNSG